MRFQRRSERLTEYQGFSGRLVAAQFISLAELLLTRNGAVFRLADVSNDPDRPAPPHRTVIRSARFTPEEWDAVRERASTAGLSPARFLRSVALGSPLGRRVNAEAVLALNRVGVNLNNLIRLATRTAQPFVAAEVTDLLNQLRNRLRELL